MIFATMEEHNRVDKIVRENGVFEDLTENEQAVMDGIYAAMQEVQSQIAEVEDYDVDDNPLYERVFDSYAEKLLWETYEHLVCRAMETYAGFCDRHVEEEGKQ